MRNALVLISLALCLTACGGDGKPSTGVSSQYANANLWMSESDAKLLRAGKIEERDCERVKRTQKVQNDLVEITPGGEVYIYVPGKPNNPADRAYSIVGNKFVPGPKFADSAGKFDITIRERSDARMVLDFTFTNEGKTESVIVPIVKLIGEEPAQYYALQENCLK